MVSSLVRARQLSGELKVDADRRDCAAELAAQCAHVGGVREERGA